MKNKNSKVEQKTWKTVSQWDVKNESIPYIDFLQWIMNNTPQGTPLENIRIDFETIDQRGYYDDIIIDSIMKLSILS